MELNGAADAQPCKKQSSGCSPAGVGGQISPSLLRNAFCHPAWCQALATGRPLSHWVLPKWLCCLPLQGWQLSFCSCRAKGREVKPEEL